MVRSFLLMACTCLAAGCASVSHLGKPEGTTSSFPRTQAYARQADVIYTPSAWPVALPADLYLPATSGTLRPAVLLIHGGGWTSRDNRYQMRGIARKLAASGYVVLNATYRGAPEAHFPAPVDDLREALRWLHSHAAEQAIDPARVAVFGYSAGGHLAMLIGLDEAARDLGVRAIVAGGAPADLRLFAYDSKLVNRFIGGTRDEFPAAFAAASPVEAVREGSPPFFLYHATGDRLVPPEHAKHMAAALAKAEVRHELYWMGRRGHVTGFIWDGGAEEAAITFLDRELRAASK